MTLCMRCGLATVYWTVWLHVHRCWSVLPEVVAYRSHVSITVMKNVVPRTRRTRSERIQCGSRVRLNTRGIPVDGAASDRINKLSPRWAAKRYAAVRFGHFRWSNGHAVQWVQLPARGFLLVFYSNRSAEMHHFRAGGLIGTDRETDRRTDSSITTLLLTCRAVILKEEGRTSLSYDTVPQWMVLCQFCNKL